jgi:hypothetical protein
VDSWPTERAQIRGDAHPTSVIEKFYKKHSRVEALRNGNMGQFRRLAKGIIGHSMPFALMINVSL